MRILVVSGIFPPDHGGPATYVPRIASALVDSGHEVVGIVTLADKTNDISQPYPFPVYRIARQSPRLLRFARVVKKIFELSRRADVVYLNGLVLEGIVATKILRRRNVVVKVVGDLVWEKAQNSGATTANLDAFQAQCQPIKWQLLKRLQGWYTAKADAVITPSEYLASVVRNWGVSPERICVVYNAVEVGGADLPAEEAAKLYDLVTVARIVPWKGIQELVTVCIRNGWTLRIVGDGPLAGDIMQLVNESKVADKISFAGQVPKSRVAQEIRSAKVFVLNSSYEGLPHIVLEAKAVGVPVVATAAGGTPETIADGVDGFLVPVGQTEILEDRLRALLNNQQERLRFASNGLDQIASQFSLSNMYAQTELVLSSVNKAPESRVH